MTRRTERYAEVAELADAVLDGAATTEQTARLEAALSGNAGARAFYLDYAAMHADAAWERRATDAVATATATPVAGRAEVAGTIGRGRWVAAAALVIAGAAVVVGMMALRGVERPDPDAGAAKPRQVGTLIETHQVVWESDPLVEGHQVTDEPIRHASGSYQMVLDSGATMDVIGGGELRIVSPMRVAMTRGRASFDCPPKAAGFTVELPGGLRVVDLGTRFTVRVDESGDSVVRVLQGTVEVYPPRGVGDADRPTMRRLTTHEAVAFHSVTGELTTASSADTEPVDTSAVVLDWHAGDGRDVEIDESLDEMTLAAWVSVRKDGAAEKELGGLLMSERWIEPGEVHWQVGGRALRLTIRNQTPGDTSSDDAAALVEANERRVMLATTFDRAAGRIAYYLGGERIGVVKLDHAEPARIGRAGVGHWRGARLFPGEVHRLTVYRQALTPRQVRGLADEPGTP